MVGPVGLPLASGVALAAPPWRRCALPWPPGDRARVRLGMPGCSAGGMYMPGMLGRRGSFQSLRSRRPALYRRDRRRHASIARAASGAIAPPPPVRLTGFQAAVSSMPFDEDESELGASAAVNLSSAGALTLAGAGVSGARRRTAAASVRRGHDANRQQVA